jgi:hypothetical protein
MGEISRRELIKAGIGAGLLGFGYPCFCAEKPNDFQIYFQVNLFKKDLTEEELKKLPEAHREALRRGNREFISIDFEPKRLVKFDLSAGKPIALNIREDNYQRIVIPRETGIVNYSAVASSPDFQNLSKNFPVFLFDDREIFEQVERYDFVADGDGRVIPIDYANGKYPRSFELRFKRSNVSYVVYGLEGIVGVKKEEMQDYWQERKKFKNFEDFQEFYREYKQGELKTSP